MYFPYLRGRQYELLALRELLKCNLLNEKIMPIIEPVKLSPTLVSLMEEFGKKDHVLSVIRNPSVGAFLSDMQDAKEESKGDSYKTRFLEGYADNSIVKSVLMQDDALQYIHEWKQQGGANNELLTICANRDEIEVFDKEFKSEYPKYVLVPDESAFRRRIRENRVLLDDKFIKKERNADYQDTEDEFFSEDHLFYKQDGYVGFSDFSVVGNDYLEAGFAPYAVVIHMVYFAEDKSLRIHHFVSDSNEDIYDPARKYHEALTKMYKWYQTSPPPVHMTIGLQTFLEHYEKGSYPGLGTVKKLSIMHHLELMGDFLREENS